MAESDNVEIQSMARALGDPSRFQIFWHVYNSAEAVGVAELTTLMGFNHNAIRQHVAQLVEVGILIEQTEQRDRPGRPRLLYSARQNSLAFLGENSRSYQRLSKLLLKAAESGESPYQVGLNAARESMASASELRDGVAGLLHQLHVGGFEPLQRDDSIVLQVCPFADVAAEGPSFVCELHRGLIDGHLRAKAQLIVKNPHEAGCEIRIAS